jgi:hypothetical protein
MPTTRHRISRQRVLSHYHRKWADDRSAVNANSSLDSAPKRGRKLDEGTRVERLVPQRGVVRRSRWMEHWAFELHSPVPLPS